MTATRNPGSPLYAPESAPWPTPRRRTTCRPRRSTAAGTPPPTPAAGTSPSSATGPGAAAVDRPGRRRGGAPARRRPAPRHGGVLVAGRPVDRVHHGARRRRADPGAVRTPRRQRTAPAGGGESGTSARLGCWQHDGSAIAVTVTESAPPGQPDRYHAEAPGPPGTGHAPQWAGRDGRAVLLDPAGGRLGPADGGVRSGSGRELEERTLSAYLVDPEGSAAPALLFSERGAANQRVCDLSRDGRLALVYRGPRGRREALVVRTEDSAVTCAFPVADGDPGSAASPRPRARCGCAATPDASTRPCSPPASARAANCTPPASSPNATTAASNSSPSVTTAAAPCSPGTGTGSATWNCSRSAPAPPHGTAAAPPPSVGDARRVELPHEVVTRIAPTADPDAPVVALSGSRRHPGVWWLPHGAPCAPLVLPRRGRLPAGSDPGAAHARTARRPGRPPARRLVLPRTRPVAR